MIADLSSSPYLSLGMIVLGIAVGCALIALLRGVFRLIITTSLLAVSLWVAYWVWLHTPGWGERLFSHPPVWVPFVIPAIAGIGTLLVLRKILSVLLNPFGSVGGRPESSGGKWFSLLMSLVPTAVLCLIAALLIRHLGTLRQVENPDSTALSALWKDVIDRHIPPSWLQRIDPLTDPLRLSLAQWISLASEEHIPRAIPVSDPGAIDPTMLQDPKWRKLLEERRFGELLRDPAIEKALHDPRVQKVLEELQRNIPQ